MQPEAAADDHRARVERVDERREHAAEALGAFGDHASAAGSASAASADGCPERRASASPLDHASTSGAPVQIALPCTPVRGRPSVTRQWLIPLPTLT